MKKGFTFAEFLIALLIIGVIAILTVPQIVSNVNKKTNVAALQRTYTSFANAVKLLMVAERAKKLSSTSLYKDTDSNVTDTAGDFLKKYFKITLDCETEPGECFASAYQNLDKDALNIPDKGEAYCVIISTGASVCLTPPDDDNPGTVVVDVNGPAKPNIAGRDYFLFYIYNDGFIGDRISAGTVDACKANSYGSGCFNRIVNSGWVMDY